MPVGQPDRSLLDRLGDQPVVRIVAYYVALFAAGVVLGHFFPRFRQVLDAHNYGAAGSVVGLGQPLPAPAPPEGTDAVLMVVLLTGAAVALMLPVAWTYVLTRAKQGYRQSLVQTLLILPVVVAGVVVVVKNSVGLAFALAGIVAAVSFRNRLEDSKDAVFIFLAIAVGLACGVQATGIAAALSVVFNLVLLLLWWSDFGRVPGALQGGAAEQRLRRALAVANRTHQFVSMLDQQILRSLAPDQLAQVANRVADRREKISADLGDEEGPAARPMTPLRVELAGAGPAARAAVEALLGTDAKRWRFIGMSPIEGGQRLEYAVRLRKKVPPALLEARLRAAAGGAVRAVEFDAAPAP
ncbi:MAG TPA: DUF4956 domain-containing protein [Gemmatimonadales bacterium]|nr:DUF4956 domain-containing protein [Gemmatimonadales bacterium]